LKDGQREARKSTHDGHDRKQGHTEWRRPPRTALPNQYRYPMRQGKRNKEYQARRGTGRTHIGHQKYD
jgi:hypothetical protein